jgi:lytic murein transglycosylase
MKRMTKALGAAALALAIGFGAPKAMAAECGRNGEGFEAWLTGFEKEAAAAGISKAAIDSSLRDVYYDRSVISHDRGQKVFRQTFEQFSARMANSFRVSKGRALLQKHAALFKRIEQKYGVPGPVIVAIWGLETDFGSYLGDFATIRALATLAYDCRRADKFRAELLDALRIVERGDLEPAQMRGAWAGEIGQTQFMPSSYLKFAVDFDGDGKRDLVHNTADVLASTANFLHGYGWKPGAGWDEGEPNFPVLLEWNKAKVYSKTIALLADKIKGATDTRASGMDAPRSSGMDAPR